MRLRNDHFMLLRRKFSVKKGTEPEGSHQSQRGVGEELVRAWLNAAGGTGFIFAILWLL